MISWLRVRKQSAHGVQSLRPAGELVDSDETSICSGRVGRDGSTIRGEIDLALPIVIITDGENVFDHQVLARAVVQLPDAVVSDGQILNVDDLSGITDIVDARGATTSDLG